MHILNWRNRPRGWVWGLAVVLVVAGVGMSVPPIIRRLAYEQTHNRVELVVSYRDVTNLSKLGGLETIDLLDRLRAENVKVSIAVEEDTVPDMVSDGRLVVVGAGDVARRLNVTVADGFDPELVAAAAKHPDRTVWLFASDSDFERVRAQMNIENPSTLVFPHSNALVVREWADDTKIQGLGFSTERVNQLRDRGFVVVLRLTNSCRVSDALIHYKFSQFESLRPIHSLIFEGTSIIGFPFHIDAVASMIESLKVPYGVIEFTDQFGMPRLLRLVPRFAIRVHSFSDAELANLSTETVVNRYVRAARERNVRLLFLKPFYLLPEGAYADDIISANITYFLEVQHRLEARSFSIGALPKSAPDHRIAIGKVGGWAVGLGVAALVWILGTLLRRSATVKPFAASLLVWTILYGGMSLVHHRLLAQQIAALGVAMVTPVIGIIVGHRLAATHTPGWRRLLRGVASLAVMFFIQIIGAIMICGLLSDYSFLIESNRFLGVKVAFLFPLIVIPMYFGINRSQLAELIPSVRSTLNAPIKLSTLILLGTAIIGVAVILVRSGNYVPSPPTSSEQMFRQWLEIMFSVRPRTKELIGYPILLIALTLPSDSSAGRWRWIGYCAGSIALISSLNSFCHFHTPFAVTGLRDIWGLGLGTLIGCLMIVVIGGIRWILKRR